MSCPPHTASCPHRNEYKAQLRASIDARKQRITPKWHTDHGTSSRPGRGDASLDESSDDDSAERPPRRARKMSTRAILNKTSQKKRDHMLSFSNTTASDPFSPPSPLAPPSCHSEPDPPSPRVRIHMECNWTPCREFRRTTWQ